MWDLRGLFERMAQVPYVRKSYQRTMLGCELMELQLFINQLVEEQHTQAPTSTSLLISKAVEYIRERYPAGTRVILHAMGDLQAPPPGTGGTVVYVDDAGQIGVAWDSGRCLSLIPGVDSFRKLTQQEIAQEQGTRMEEMKL